MLCLVFAVLLCSDSWFIHASAYSYSGILPLHSVNSFLSMANNRTVKVNTTLLHMH